MLSLSFLFVAKRQSWTIGMGRPDGRDEGGRMAGGYPDTDIPHWPYVAVQICKVRADGFWASST